MKERPILMSPPMIQAILDDRKSQTRRVMKPQPEFVTGSGKRVYRNEDFKKSWESVSGTGEGDGYSDCPYGQPGDRLWIKETYYAFGRWETRFNFKKHRDEWHFVDLTERMKLGYAYADNPPKTVQQTRGGTGTGWWKRSSLFMPRAASRIALKITGIRAERLQDISERDAVAEGILPQIWYEEATDEYQNCWENYAKTGYTALSDPRESYRTLWESLNGPDSWDANPWVWVVTFMQPAINNHAEVPDQLPPLIIGTDIAEECAGKAFVWNEQSGEESMWRHKGLNITERFIRTVWGEWFLKHPDCDQLFPPAPPTS